MSGRSGLQARAASVTLARGRPPALHAIDLTLQPGWTAIVGPNGAGKSTLLRALAGLQALDSGEVCLDNVPLVRLPLRERARRIAWLPQAGPVDTELRVYDVVRLGRLPHCGLHAAPTATDEARVQHALSATGCVHLQHRPLPHLSGGERQRVLLARALAVDATVLLLDEPTAHLDPRHQLDVAALLRRLADAGHVVVSVLHDVSLALRADRVAVLVDGRVVGHGATSDRLVHRALESAFDDAFAVRASGGRWHALAT